jgi:integrase
MALNIKQIEALKPSEKPYKVADSGGLYLEISPVGGKSWKLKYRFLGKEKKLSLGRYPVVSLKDAREKRDEAKRVLDSGKDPGAEKKRAKIEVLEAQENTFQSVAEEWSGRHFVNKAPAHKARVVSRLEKNIYPYIGAKPVVEITPADILRVIQLIEKRGAIETAHRALQNISQVMRYAVATCRLTIDPTPSLRGALLPVTPSHMAAPTTADEVAGFLRLIDAFTGGQVVSAALRLLPMVFVRPGTFRRMEWSEVDLEKAEWNIPADKMKMKEPHYVPLSRQAVAILRDELQPISGNEKYVFPGGRTDARPMSESAINGAYKRLGIDTRAELTAHGWRATARTLLHEVLGYDPAVIEHQLAHRVADALGRAYNRTRFLEKRREMMQTWADYLDELKAGRDRKVIDLM